MLSEIFRQYVQVTILKVTPQELPGHTLFLWISVACAFVTSVAGLLFAYELGDAVFRAFLAIVIPGLVVYAMLGVKNLQTRFVQTYGALCGSAAVIYLIALPLMPAFFAAMREAQSGALIVYVVLLLDLWTLIITAHVLRNSFEVGFATGISLAVALLILTLMTMEVVAPGAQFTQSAVDGH